MNSIENASGIIMIPYAEVLGHNTSVNINHNSERITTYLKNCCVALISAKKHNPSYDVALVSNIDIKEPFLSLLQKNDILIIKVPFDSFNFNAEYTWSLAFYKLCALYHISKECKYDYYAYLDADIYVQNSFNDIFEECNSHILMYDINHGLQVKNFNQFLLEVHSFLSNDKIITQYGGEFFAANRENAIKFSNECEIVYKKMLSCSFTTTQGDEFITSIVADKLSYNVRNAGAYVYRFWTGKFRLISTNYEYNPVVVLHVPTEKETGMIEIYDKYISKSKVPSQEKVWKLLHLNRSYFKIVFKEMICRIIKR